MFILLYHHRIDLEWMLPLPYVNFGNFRTNTHACRIHKRECRLMASLSFRAIRNFEFCWFRELCHSPDVNMSTFRTCISCLGHWDALSWYLPSLRLTGSDLKSLEYNSFFTENLCHIYKILSVTLWNSWFLPSHLYLLLVFFVCMLVCLFAHLLFMIK